jgi:hypothetical protein
MQRLAFAAQQHAISRVLDKGVLEPVRRVRRGTPLEDQARRGELLQGIPEGSVRNRRDPRQHS